MRNCNGFAEDAMRLDASTLAMFYTRAGWLTSYALACGYIERTPEGVELYAEHGVYHVRAPGTGPTRIRESFRLLGEARARFRALRGAS